MSGVEFFVEADDEYARTFLCNSEVFGVELAFKQPEARIFKERLELRKCFLVLARLDAQHVLENEEVELVLLVERRQNLRVVARQIVARIVGRKVIVANGKCLARRAADHAARRAFCVQTFIIFDDLLPRFLQQVRHARSRRHITTTGAIVIVGLNYDWTGVIGQRHRKTRFFKTVIESTTTTKEANYRRLLPVLSVSYSYK